jgi:hypothetical protein
MQRTRRAVNVAMPDGLWLFSYGTLQLEKVQRELFGRRLTGRPDMLAGFALDSITIENPAVLAASGVEVHRILRRDPNAPVIPGVALAITPGDLLAADAYEGADYVRVVVTLTSGRAAFVYVAPE